MSKRIHVGIGSTYSMPGDVEGNLEQIRRFARRGAEDGVDLLLTPEMSATGAGDYPEILARAEPAGGGDVYSGLAEIAGETGVVVSAGFAERYDGSGDDKIHICQYVVYPDGRFVVQRKHRLNELEKPYTAPVEVTQQSWYREPADASFEAFEVAGVRCAMTICADSGIPGVEDKLHALGTELVLLPTGAGGRRDQRVTTEEMRSVGGRRRYDELLRSVFYPGDGVLKALNNGWAMAAVNLVGYDGHKEYHIGHGMIITPMGEIPALIHGLPNLDRQRPMYAHAEIDVSEKLV